MNTSAKSPIKGNNIDIKIKIQNHPLQKTPQNLSTKDTNETKVAAISTAYKSATKNINIRATGQQQTSINENSHNEQPETSNSVQRDNINSFSYDRLAYSSSLNDQQNRATGMGTQNYSISQQYKHSICQQLFHNQFHFTRLTLKLFQRLIIRNSTVTRADWSTSK